MPGIYGDISHQKIGHFLHDVQSIKAHLFRVLATYFDPFLFAMDGYFRCKKACSSLTASDIFFFVFISSWLLHITPKKKSKMIQRAQYLTQSVNEKLKTFSEIIYSIQLLYSPMIPNLTGITLPHKTSIASVPASIRSNLVTTANVLRPSGSTLFAN